MAERVLAHFDAAAREVKDGQMPTGVVGFMSFTRLIETLERAGEVKPTERVTHIEITERGLNIRYEHKRESKDDGEIDF